MIIGVDMDSVIAEMVRPLDSFHNRVYGTKIKYDDHLEYELQLYWHCTDAEVFTRLFEFYESKEFTNMLPIEGSQKALRNLAKKHELHLITARPHDIEEQTHAWINRYFKGIFKDIHHTNLISKGGIGVGVKKSAICKKMGAKIIIEDFMHYALDCADNGIQTLLFPAPWNIQKDIKHASIKKVSGWEDVEIAIDLFDSL
jgi:uncharacterized HAD superfamily protein